MQLEDYSQPACNKFCASNHDTLDRRRCNQQAVPSTRFFDHTIDLQNFLSPEFGAKFQREVGLPLLLEVPEFPYNTV